MADLSNLSPTEYETITNVLKRDRELRSMEEARIRQLKQELICLRKRAALKPGFDPLRNCARCLTELGRILNRGALCPVCLKKVCKDCRHYGDENHEWLCIYCYKQMQLKAISGEWMFEFSRLSIQNRAKDSPGDELRKVLHDTQRRGMLSNEVTETVFPQLPNDDPPEKPPRIFTYEPPSPNASLVEEIQVHLQVEENKTDSTDLCVEKASPEPQKDIHQSSPKLLPRISPWSDIDPEPTLPPRIDKTRPVGGIQQFESLSFKERQSSDEGHSTGGYRSRSVSSEVMDESEPHFPVPLPRKRIIPLKKQQAIPDKSSVDNQQSSVDTTDSGVCSPVLKTDFSLDTNPASPLAVSRLSSNEQESIDSPTFAHCLASESSLSEDDDRRPQIKISGNFFRKRKSAHSRSAEDKCSATSAETRLMPALGLSHSFTHYNVYSNPLDNTNFKQQLIGSYLNFSNFSRSDSYADACCKNTKHILTRSNFHLNSRACALHCSIEARGSGSKNDMLKNSQLDESAVYTKQLSEEHNGIKSKRRDRRKKYLLQLPHLKRKRGRKKDHICSTMQQKTGDSSKSSTELKSTAYSKSQSCININSLNAHAEFKKCSDTICPNRDEKSRSTLVRSASLPSNKTFSEDWLKPWLWKCHSLEDWLWYLEEQPYQSRNFSEISNMLPDDYKLVYVSSSSSDSDEPATVLDLLIDCQSKFSSKTHLKVNSHMKINYGTSYIEDSDWELESEDSAESDSITNCKTGSKINEANNFLINYVPHIDQKSLRDIRGSPCDNLALNFNKSSESHHTFQSYIPVIYSANIPLIDFRFLSKKHRSFHEHALRKKLQSNIKIQSCRSHSGYGERKIVESLEESSTLIFKENIPSWPSFSSERPNSLLLSALCCSFENNDGEKPDFVLDQSHCFRTNLHKQLIHETVLVISSQAVSDLFSQYLKHISKPYFEIIFSQHNSPHDSEFYSLFSDSSKVVSIFANNLNSLSFPRVISDNILFSRSLIQLNKLLSPPNVNITHDSLFTLCNENSTVPFQFKFIAERDSYILIFAPRVYTRNKFKAVNKNVFSHAFVHLNTSTNSLSEFYNVFKECFESRTSRSDMFHSVSWWRDCCEEKVGNWLQLDDANAFHYTAFPLSSYSTNRGNDNSATGWGKLRCCIAVATQRVIDLNPRALVCGREVLDSADLTSYLRWEAGTDDKLGKSENLVNAFLYRNPPVFQIPEADYLFCLTRSELCVLFQRSLHARVEIRMIAAKFGVTGVSAFDKTDHDSKLSPNKTEKNCEEMQSERTENFSQNGNHQFAVDSTWINTNEEIFSIHCQSRISDGGSRKNVNKQETSLLRWNAVDSVDYDKCSLRKQTIGSTNNDASCYKFNLQMKDSVKELPHDDCVAPGAENLLCIENTLDSELNEEYRNCDHSAVKVHSVVSDYSDSNERVDCQCNKPCEVPLSPSVVDATVERSIIDDGEILSSGDELDKFESDTDSQDTVIEGEAYKRIRSVAIKEKILHANEELFGTNSKETFYSYSSGAFNDNPVINRNENSKPQVKMCSVDEIRSKISPQSFLQTHYQNDIPELPIFSDSEESDSPTVFSSLEKHFLSFKNQNLSTSHSASSAFSELKSEDSCNSSFYPSFNETTCSSESSDNGSDGEEVILSDTSTSSDEATYIAPASGFQYYSHPVSYKLHTIAEESCEESERSSRNSLPLSKSCSDFEYYDKTRLSLAKNPRKTHRKLIPDSTILAPNTEFKSGKGSAVYAVLATSRLEKYFKSSLQDGDKVSYPDDDMTDESGEVSSEEDLASDRLINQMIVGKKIENFYKSPKLPSSSDWCIAAGKYNRFGSPSSIKSSNTESKMRQHVEIRKEFDFGSPVPKSEHNTSELKRNKVNDQVPDDEAKYIMNHLMQHITNNTDIRQENTSEIKDMSPMLKILESEIARLMLTVSPASLSTGEPSSSCSSTIGSNNSDYGSDTLESAEESTSEEEINAEIAPENRPDGDAPEQIDSFSASTSNETVASDNVPSDFAPSCGDPVVSEETLYICKQLMASLKKIADSTEGAYASDDLCAGAEDHTAKQYITDQIVSLMQTVNASHNSSPLLRRLSSNPSAIQIDSDISQDHSDSDSPPPNDDKREHSKSKTPSESGSETTISASISIPSYDDSDRTPTESEISHEMDELYALLESSSASQDMINSAKFSYDFDNHSLDKSVTSRNADSPLSEEDINFSFTESSDVNPNSAESGSSLLYGAASKLESLLPITIEERIARYKDAFLNKIVDNKDLEVKAPEMRINVILPQPSVSENITDDIPTNSTSLPSDFDPIFNTKSSEKLSTVKSCEDIVSCCIHKVKSEETSYNITSVKIISHNTYPPSSAIHKILSNNIDSTYLDHQKHDSNIVNICDASSCKASTSNEILMGDDTSINDSNADQCTEESESTILSPLPKVINPKEKASSENDLLVANYRTKYKGNKVFGTKSVGNICELENISNKSTFRDTGYYSFKSSEESFLSLDDSTASQTSTASLTQYRSLTSTETIPEEEESCAKGTASTKMSLSSSNIPDAVCDNSPSKSSTLPLSLRNKLSSTSNSNHRTRSSFFSTSGVLRKLTLLRDESGNSLRSSPHNRYNPRRNRSSSGGSEDGKQKKATPHKHESLESQSGRLSAASSEKDSSGIQDEDIDQHLSFTTRSQMSLSSFGGRSESVTSVYSAAGGRRYGTVIVTGDVLFGLNYCYKVGVLEVNIKECRNLAAVDTKKNRSDPYVKVYLLPDRTKSGKRKTKVKKHTLNPVFDELLKFQVTVSELEIRTLWLSVWHSDRFGRNDFLGEVMLPLGNDTFENSGLKWYPLQERLETLDPPVSYKGDLILALKYVPPDVTSRRFSKKPGIPAKGALEVLVREARNLMATRSNGTSDPFCKSYLLPDKSKAGKQKTPVFKKSCNPKWNHTFVYDDVSLDDLRERCLELTIWDYDKITSNDFLGGVRLCLGTGKYQGREVDWMDSVGEERSLWYTMLDRPNTWVDGSLLLRCNMQSRRIV